MESMPDRRVKTAWPLSLLAMMAGLWITFLGVAFPAAPVHAAQKGDITCGPRHELAAGLDRDFDEQPLFRGVTALGNLVEVFTSGEGSWTILVDHPGGFSCVLSAGSPWEISDFAWRALQTPAVFIPPAY